MTIALTTLCLNEMEFLPKLYRQHKDWPKLKTWVFVEAADVLYSKANPKLVTPKGLSVDGTTDFLDRLAQSDDRVIHIKHGYSNHSDREQCKCQARQRYLDELENVRPDYMFVMDADEFYTFRSQQVIEPKMQSFPSKAVHVFRHRTLWKPPNMHNLSRFDFEVRGEFWDMQFCRGWKWSSGMRYIDKHNHVYNSDGNSLWRKGGAIRHSEPPLCLHMGYTAMAATREAKRRYYELRGERRSRQAYMEASDSYLTWKPGAPFSSGRVMRYKGPVPEVYQP